MAKNSLWRSEIGPKAFDKLNPKPDSSQSQNPARPDPKCPAWFTTLCGTTQLSGIVIEQERFLAEYTRPQPSHAIRKAKSVRALAFQARGC